MSRNTLIALGVAVLIALGAGGWYLMNGSAPAAGSGAGFDILSTDRTLGNPKAKVTLIEYAAPVCPHCSRFNTEVFPRIKKDYIDTGKIYYVFRVFPISPADGPAEKIARCLPEDKYFAFIDLLFRNQPKWDPEYGLTPDQVHEGLILMGRIAGISAQQVDQCMAPNKAEDDRINKVASDGQSRYSISSTPTFIVNGVSQGQFDFTTLPQVLDKELAKHKAG